MPGVMTYGEVRDFVQNMAGGDCCIEQSALEVLMLNCLEDMRNRIGYVPELHTTVTLVTVVDQDVYTKPAVLDRITSISLGNCELVHNQPPCGDPCVPVSSKTSGLIGWWEEAGQIILWPTPKKVETLTLRGTAVRDCVLYVDDASGVRNWQEVKLPAGLHTVYAKCVLGMALMPTDPAQGLFWMEQAAAELAAWKNARDRQIAPTRSPLAWGSKALTRTRFCCGRRRCSCGAMSAADLYVES